MTDFEIEIDGNKYKGQLQQFGYSYRIVLWVDDIPVCFEPDEEKNFRLIVPLEKINKVKPELLKLIVDELQDALQ